MRCKSCNFFINKKSKTFKNFIITNNYIYHEMKKKINLDFFTCSKCGLLQIKKNFENKYILPVGNISKQKEPEEHLDKVVNIVSKKTKLNKNCHILGLTYKDQSLIQRFKSRGYKNSKIFKLDSDNHNFEIMEEILNCKNAKKYSKNQKVKKFDLIILRHYFEHVFSIKNFFEFVNILIKPNGYLLVEVPDSLKSLKNFDYLMMWEQHKSYFTPNSLNNVMNVSGFKKNFFYNAKYPYENCMVYLGRKSLRIKNYSEKNFDKKKIFFEKKIINSYFSKFDKYFYIINRYFKKIKRNNKVIAIFGAGHQSASFVHLFKLQKFLNYILDNNKNLKNKFLPGSNLRIMEPKSKLFKSKIDLCFMIASQLNEKLIKKNNREILNHQGKFLSLSFLSKKKLYKI